MNPPETWYSPDEGCDVIDANALEDYLTWLAKESVEDHDSIQSLLDKLFPEHSPHKPRDY